MQDIYAQAEEILASVSTDVPLPARRTMLQFATDYGVKLRGPVKTLKGQGVAMAALLWSWLRVGRPSRATKLLDTVEFMRLIETDSAMSLDDRCLAYSVVAEAALLSSDLGGAYAAAKSALQYGHPGDDDPMTEHGRGVLACVLALNGEMRAAKELLRGVAGLPDTPSEKSARYWAPMLARYRICVRLGEAPVQDNRGVEGQGSVRGPIMHGLVTYQTATTHMLEGESNEALVLCERYRGGLDYHEAPLLFQQLIMSTEASTLAQLGQPGSVIGLLEGREQPEDHFVCFSHLIANAHLNLNNPEDALEALAECTKLGSGHAGATKASSLVREAIAHELLGHQDLADKAFSKAWHMGHNESYIVTPIGVPLEVLMQVGERMKVNEPHRAEEIDAINANALMRRNVPQLERHYGELTEREVEIAAQLDTGKTLAAIAKDSKVSVNTVKSQVRSIYRKLGVASREEAIAVLREVGYST